MSIEDRAQEHEALVWERNNRARSVDPTHRPGSPGYGPEECESCEDTMPDVRRAYGFRKCTACTEAQDRLRDRR